jgi:hypothetical protein
MAEHTDATIHVGVSSSVASDDSDMADADDARAISSSLSSFSYGPEMKQLVQVRVAL